MAAPAAPVAPIPRHFPCNALDHLWVAIDFTNAAANHPTTYLHVPNDAVIDNNPRASAIVVGNPAPAFLTFPEIVERVLTVGVLDEMIRGINQYGGANFRAITLG